MMFLSGHRLKKLTVMVLAGVFASAAAFGLDYTDVKNLMQNRVAEEVIINMVASDGNLYITTEEADEMRAMGASENLIAALRPRDTTAAYSPTVVQQQPTVVQTPTVVTTTAEPAIVTEIAGGPAEGSPITPVAIRIMGSHPPRYDKEGWLSISNYDWSPYYISINQGDKRIFISRAPNGGMAVDSGQNVVVNLRKETYKMYGDSGEKLEVKVRENETTRLSLNPFGVFGNSGLSGVAVDRDRVRSEILFNNYVPAPTVVVQEAPVIIVPSAPPPPPPVYYYGPGYRHRPYHRGDGGVYFRYHNW